MTKSPTQSPRDKINDLINYLLFKIERAEMLAQLRRARMDFRLHHQVGCALVDIFGSYDDPQAKAALARALKRGRWVIPPSMLLEVHRLASEQPNFARIRAKSFAEYRQKKWGEKTQPMNPALKAVAEGMRNPITDDNAP